MEYRDYYKILGVERTASADEIKKVYRRLPPWLGMVWWVWGAVRVVELPAGTLDGLELPPGEPLEIA